MNCKCKRCGYEWWPRKNPDDIVSCASCKSRAWRVAPAPPSKEVESLEERNQREVEEQLVATKEGVGHFCIGKDCSICNPNTDLGGRCS